jgi:hypothetical protein
MSSDVPIYAVVISEWHLGLLVVVAIAALVVACGSIYASMRTLGEINQAVAKLQDLEVIAAWRLKAMPDTAAREPAGPPRHDKGELADMKDPRNL